MNRRKFVFVLAAVGMATTRAQAQMSQRARQIRQRQACEQDLPECKPDIGVQLEAERRRMRFGLATFALLIGVLGGLLVRRYRRVKDASEAAARRLEERLTSQTGDSSINEAE